MAAVVEGSRGNPLLASQLVAAGAELAGLRLSDPFDDILLARVAALDQRTVRVLKLLAAARRPLTHDELAKVRLADGHLARNAATAAKSSGFAVATKHGVAIIHELCAEAIEGSLLPLERHSLHAALAELDERRARRGGVALGANCAAAPRHERRISRRRAAAAHVEPGETALLHYAAALELQRQRTGSGRGACSRRLRLLPRPRPRSGAPPRTLSRRCGALPAAAWNGS